MPTDVARRFGRSATTYDSAATVQHDVADRLLCALLPHVAPLACTGVRLFEVGCGTGYLSTRLARDVRPKKFIVNDLSCDMLRLAMARLAADGVGGVSPLAGDAEAFCWPEADVIVSSSAVQWFASPLVAVSKAARALPRGGLFAIATYGPQTFCELRGGVPNAYPTHAEWLLAFESEGFRLLHSESFTTVQTFASRMALLRMVAATGVGTKRSAQSSEGLKGECALTWQPIVMVGRKS